MAGRAGVANKSKQSLLALLKRRYPGYQPVLELAKIANDDVKCTKCKATGKVGGEDCKYCDGGMVVISLDQRMQANKEVASYTNSKLRSMEVKAEVDAQVTFKWES